MTPVRVGGWSFDHALYDRDADVLYLSSGPPVPGYGEETPEGHVLRFDEHGRFVGLTLIGVAEILSERDTGVTLPSRATIGRAELQPALG